MRNSSKIPSLAIEAIIPDTEDHIFAIEAVPCTNEPVMAEAARKREADLAASLIQSQQSRKKLNQLQKELGIDSGYPKHFKVCNAQFSVFNQ